jgi:hypothetical protein
MGCNLKKGGNDVDESQVRMAIEALERLMDEQEGRGEARHVILFQVFVGQRCVGGRAPFFLDSRAATSFYADLVRNIRLEALAVHQDATRATVTLHGKTDEWNRKEPPANNPPSPPLTWTHG